MSTVYQMVSKRLKAKSKKKYHKSKSNNMAKRKGKSRGKRGGFVSKGFGFLKNPTVQKGATALGMGTLFAVGAARFSPQNTQIASLGGEYLGGGLEGVLIAEGIKLLAGAPSALSGLGGSGGMNGSAGFA